MPMSIHCPGCNALLQVQESAAGRNVKCPKCQTVMVVPAPEPEPGFEASAGERPRSNAGSDEGPRRRPSRRDERDDDDEAPRRRRRREEDYDEDDEPPRRRRRYEEDDDERPRRRSHRDEDGDDEDDGEANDDYDAPRSPRRSMPGIVKAAAIIWICYGGLAICNALINVALAAGQQGKGPSPASPCCGFLIAIAFVVCGSQTLTGKAKDTLGNSIGSLLLGSLQGLLGIVLIALGGGGIAKNLQIEPGLVVIVGLVVCFMGSLLILAGILGLKGRQGYKDWRRANRKDGGRRRPRRRRRDDDEDDE